MGQIGPIDYRRSFRSKNLVRSIGPHWIMKMVYAVAISLKNRERISRGRKHLASRSGKVAVLLLALYFALGLFSEVWLVFVGKAKVGHDFDIYYEALTKAQAGGDPYAPYQIGISFLYHPFVLSLLSPFSLIGFRAALSIWLTICLAAWIASIVLLLRMNRQMADDQTVPLLTQPWVLGAIVVLLLAFGPFGEVLHVGQINSLVVLALVLAFYCSERRRPYWAGIWLAIAVVLKTSPFVMIAYFLSIRQFRTVVVTVMLQTVFLLMAGAQFGWSVIDKFLQILPQLSSKVHPSVNNQSWTSLSYRLALYLSQFDLGEPLITVHKVVVFLLLLALFLVGIRLFPGTMQSRAWIYGTFVTVMTISSPIIWYHHSVFLVIPLALSFAYRDRLWIILGAAILLLIQGDRLFEFVTLRYAAPIFLAHAGLMAALIMTYFRYYHQSPHSEKAKIGPCSQG